MGEGSVALLPGVGFTLSLEQLWDGEEEMINLPVMGTVEPFVTKDLKITVEDIFGLEDNRRDLPYC